jgi:uncharacterized membrane protein
VGIHPLWIGFSMLVGLFLLGGFVLLVLLVVRSLTAQGHPGAYHPAPPPMRETPLDILARRFASGEITADDYERARKLLKEGAG